MRLALVALAACSTIESPTPRFTEAEAKQLADAELARIAANPRTGCAAAPVGSALPGDSTDEVLAIMATPCLQPLVPAPRWEAGAPEALAMDTACGDAVAAAVRHAARHVAGCSPYIVGVRRFPLAAITITSNLAQLMARHPDAVLAAIRVVHDLGRGRVPQIAAYLSKTLAVKALAPRLPVGTAIPEGPPPGEQREGWHQEQALRLALPFIEPSGWVPPGGASDDVATGEPGVPGYEFGAAWLAAIEVDRTTAPHHVDPPNLTPVWRSGTREQLVAALVQMLQAER